MNIQEINQLISYHKQLISYHKTCIEELKDQKERELKEHQQSVLADVQTKLAVVLSKFPCVIDPILSWCIFNDKNLDRILDNVYLQFWQGIDNNQELKDIVSFYGENKIELLNWDNKNVFIDILEARSFLILGSNFNNINTLKLLQKKYSLQWSYDDIQNIRDYLNSIEKTFSELSK